LTETTTAATTTRTTTTRTSGLLLHFILERGQLLFLLRSRVLDASLLRFFVLHVATLLRFFDGAEAEELVVHEALEGDQLGAERQGFRLERGKKKKARG